MHNFYFDSCVFDAAQLHSLIATYGSSRLLLGSDFPFDLSDPTPVATIQELRLPPEEEAAVLGGNAARILPGIAGTDDIDASSYPGEGAAGSDHAHQAGPGGRAS